jgi:5-methylcytosine-specific restriction enzyme subunit McrC
MAWLYDILRDGILKDNQIYDARNGKLENCHWQEPLPLDQAYRRTKPHHKEDAIWRFLIHTREKVSDSLRNGTAESLVLFNDKDYEHNTTDEFIELQGSDALNFKLTTGNLVGCVKQGEYSLKISSRFGDAFLRYIIADADGFLELDNLGGDGSDGDYDWLLAYLWMIKLKRAYRLGMPKGYVGKTETTFRVRGSIDPLRFAIDGGKNRYHCNYREHSYSTPQTILIAEAFRRLKKHSLLKDVYNVASNFTVASEGKRVSRSKLLSTPPFSNPFYADYNDIVELSKKVVRNESTDVGDQSENSAFLFDISMLFEYFVRKLLKRGGARFYPKRDGSWGIPCAGLHKSKHKLEPDLVFTLGNKTCVFDVKYKAYDFRQGVSREDLFQIHTYVGQCSNVYNVAACGLIYPVTEKTWQDYQLGTRSGVFSDSFCIARKRVPFRVSFIRVPPDDAHFGRVFKDSCRVFTEELRSAIIT